MLAWLPEKFVLHAKCQIKKKTNKKTLEGKRVGEKIKKTKVYDFFTFNQNRLRIKYRLTGILNLYS